MEILMDTKVQSIVTLKDLNPGELFKFIEDAKESSPDIVYMRGDRYPSVNTIYCMRLIDGDTDTYNYDSEVIRLYGRLTVSDVELAVTNADE